MNMETDIEQKSILFFDGACNLCNGFVQFLIVRDPKAHFSYASLQSKLGQEFLQKAGLPTQELSTVILYDKGKFYTHSDVALRIVRRMPGLWPLLAVFSIIPKLIRDAIYNWIARNRYKWFGKKEQCMLPRPEWRSRFLST